MATYHVKNGSHLDKAFKVRGGHLVVPAGKEAEVADAKELTEAQIDAFAREGVKVKTKGAKEQKDDQPSAYQAKHRGGGSYSVLDAAGTEVVEKLSKEDAEAFNAMKPAEQAEYVEVSKAKA